METQKYPTIQIHYTKGITVSLQNIEVEHYTEEELNMPDLRTKKLVATNYKIHCYWTS